MEGTHGELGARLTDRLGGDNAHGLTNINHRAARKIATVADSANAFLGLAGQHRADLDVFDAGRLDSQHRGFIDQTGARHQHLVANRIEDIDRGGTPENAVGQRRDHLGTFDHRRHIEARDCATIYLGDDHILGNINETARQVA